MEELLFNNNNNNKDSNTMNMNTTTMNITMNMNTTTMNMNTTTNNTTNSTTTTIDTTNTTSTWIHQQAQELIQEELKHISSITSNNMLSLSSSPNHLIDDDDEDNNKHSTPCSQHYLWIYQIMLKDLLELFNNPSMKDTPQQSLQQSTFRLWTFEILEKQYKERLSEEMHDLFHFTFMDDDERGILENPSTNSTTTTKTSITSSHHGDMLNIHPSHFQKHSLPPNKLVVKRIQVVQNLFEEIEVKRWSIWREVNYIMIESGGCVQVVVVILIVILIVVTIVVVIVVAPVVVVIVIILMRTLSMIFHILFNTLKRMEWNH